MNKYLVNYTAKALQQLKKLDPYTKKTIIAWIEKNLVDCEDPRQRGKGLTANRSGEWRYRVGDYRIIAKIQDNIVTVLVLEVGHRNKIYDN